MVTDSCFFEAVITLLGADVDALRAPLSYFAVQFNAGSGGAEAAC
jgi:hypothetical protein